MKNGCTQTIVEELKKKLCWKTAKIHMSFRVSKNGKKEWASAVFFDSMSKGPVNIWPSKIDAILSQNLPKIRGNFVCFINDKINRGGYLRPKNCRCVTIPEMIKLYVATENSPKLCESASELDFMKFGYLLSMKAKCSMECDSCEAETDALRRLCL